MISFLLMLLVVVVPTALGSGIFGAEKTLDGGIISMLIMLGLGVIAASSMVIPGVSGSMMLMILGYYTAVLGSVNQTVKSLIGFDFETLLGNLQLLIPFGIGVIIGIFLMAKIIDKLLKRYPLATVWGIIGLVLASGFAILASNKEIFIGVTWVTLLISLVTCLLGYLVARKMSMDNIKIPKKED